MCALQEYEDDPTIAARPWCNWCSTISVVLRQNKTREMHLDRLALRKKQQKKKEEQEEAKRSGRIPSQQRFTAEVGMLAQGWLGLLNWMA